MLLQDPLTITLLILTLFTLGYLYTDLSSPLRSISGHFLARFSRLWYYRQTLSGDFERTNLSLHVEHGHIIRLAPNTYSISDPSAIKTIYMPKDKSLQFRKADFYTAWEPPHKPNILSERNPVSHDVMRKKLNSSYTMSVMASYEGYVDNCISILSQRLHEKKGQEVDMAWWLQCFAFDVIGEITYSKRFGFLDKGEDVNKLIENVQGNTKYSLRMGIWNEWHEVYTNVKAWLAKLGLAKASEKNYILNYTLKRIEERKQQLKQGSDEDIQDSNAPKDFMTKFLQQHLNKPEHFTIFDIINGVGGNINAGSDTTSITLSAMVYYLVKNPQCLQRLRNELEKHNTSNPITFKEAQALPYLQAIIKETLRLHPPVGVPLPRVVPTGGALISDHFFPAGAVVGMNPYVLHRDRQVYGEDADVFRPERWLKNETDHETLSKMEHSWSPFGFGSRICIGKNVSLLEISKLIPQLVREFDFEMSDELKRDGLKTENEFFVLVRNLRLRVRERKV